MAVERSAPKIIVDCDHKYWGDGDSNPIADPNPRLQLLIEAARRGAKVRVLLDSFFYEPEAWRQLKPAFWGNQVLANPDK